MSFRRAGILFTLLLALIVFMFLPLFGGDYKKNNDVSYVFVPASAFGSLQNRSANAPALVPALAPALAPYASASVLMDADSGRIVYSRNADLILPMASTTKIMTAVIILETLDLDSEVTITKAAAGTEGSSIYLAEGEVLTVRDLLYGLMLRSGNDAAAALAIACAGSIDNFAGMMNAKARELGLFDTYFENPSGLPSPNHHTTALDLASLASYALKNSEFVKITSTKKATIKGSRLLYNRNSLLGSYPGMIGVKTGYTPQAGKCLVTAAARNGVTLVAVTLNDSNQWSDHSKMLNYGFETLARTSALKPGEVRTEIAVAGGKESFVAAANPTGFDCSLFKGEKIEIIISAKKLVFAPVTKGEKIGEALIYASGHLMGSVAIVAEIGVEKRRYNFFERFLF
ncbi:MAG: D-alanyl-D-alanine carboxypeptidase family protein [Eubacteriales bacterium]